MSEQCLRVLSVGDDPDATELLREAFLEIEEKRFSQPWLRLCQCDYTADLGQAISLLRETPFDAVLLDLSIPGSLESSAFETIRDRVPVTPVIVLAERGDEPQALALVRRGAQDFLVKSELDCEPLARALRCAVERTRLGFAQLTLCDNGRIENRAGRVV